LGILELQHGGVIVVEGNIGTGKTGLCDEVRTDLLTKGVVPDDIIIVDEPSIGTPKGRDLLEKFCDDPERWAFELQMFMMTNRHATYKRYSVIAKREKKIVILDRSLLADSVFAKANRGRMKAEEYAEYEAAYARACSNITPPMMIIYLHSPPEICLERVKVRGRACEMDMELEYLQTLDGIFEEWVGSLEGHMVRDVDWSFDKHSAEGAGTFRERIEAITTDIVNALTR